jgi:DNA adenine methylase
MYQKPFLKWVGGKTQIIDSVIGKFPKQMNNYHETFLGGGSVLLALLTLVNEKKIVIKGTINAYDINKNLIHVYKNIQDNIEELLEELTILKEEYKGLTGKEKIRNPKNEEEAKGSKESYYYWCRTCFNLMDKYTPKHSAYFIFLNKIGFRGMYREGPNGFNVPFGHYKKVPEIFNKDQLYKIQKLFKNVNFYCQSFEDSLKNVDTGDYVYLDPPYVKENKKSFVGYNKKGFDLDTHKRLFSMVKELKVKFTMSNSSVPLVKNTFEGYEICELEARRAINSKNPGSTTTEVIISHKTY